MNMKVGHWHGSLQDKNNIQFVKKNCHPQGAILVVERTRFTWHPV